MTAKLERLKIEKMTLDKKNRYQENIWFTTQWRTAELTNSNEDLLMSFDATSFYSIAVADVESIYPRNWIRLCIYSR